MNEKESKIERPLPNDRKIFNYIYQNPNCTKADMYKTLTHNNYKGKYIRREMNPKTFRNRLTWLINNDHIIEINKRYCINEELLSFYPEVKHKEIIRLSKLKDQVLKNKIISKIRFDDFKNYRPILMNTNITLDSEIKLYFSNEMENLLNLYIYNLMIKCFYNNPDNWKNFKKPEDMDFTLTIEANWSNDKRIFERFLKRKEFCLKEEYLQPITLGIKQSTKEQLKERMKGKNEDLHFKIAHSESITSRKENKEILHQVSLIKPKYIKCVNNEIERYKDNPIRLKSLRDLKEDIKREYESFHSGTPVIKWYNNKNVDILTEEIIKKEKENEKRFKEFKKQRQKESQERIKKSLKEKYGSKWREEFDKLMEIVKRDKDKSVEQIIEEKIKKLN